MKTQTINSGIYLGVLAMAFCLCVEASAGTTGFENRLRFLGNDGWSRPSVERAEDNTVVILRFSKTPENAVEELESMLTEDKRTVFTQAEFYPQKRGGLVRLSLARRVDTVKRKRYQTRNWLITVQLETEQPIPAASYATLIPSGLEKIAYEESERDLETSDPRCAVFRVLNETDASWSSFALLSLMDCYQARRNPRKARQIALDIRKDRNASSIIHILATLRLSEWPKQKPLRLRRELTREEQMNLPVGIAQEALLRLTRLAIRKDRYQDALNHFKAAIARGPVDSRLSSSAQELRLRLLAESAENNNTEETLFLVDALPLPPLDHVSYPGTARISAMALAQAGRADEAAEAAAGIINTEGVLVDRKLGRRLFHAFTRAGLFEEVHWISHLVEPGDVFFATQAGLEPLSDSASSILAMWVMKTWDDKGPQEAARISEPAKKWNDTPGILSEARGAALLGARECNQITKTTDLNKAMASVCFLASGDSQTASDVWSTEQNAQDSDNWTWAVRNHAVASASFFEEMNGLNVNDAGRTN